MQIYTIKRDEIERYKLADENHGLPDNLDLLVAAVAYDRADNRAINAAAGIRWIDAEMCDADDNVIDMADVPKRTIYRLVNEQQIRRRFDKQRDDHLRSLGMLS
tara:strand:- start:859 stop:1170 length:312 start_codon:yes stop_codon:yes gene_type:complete